MSINLLPNFAEFLRNQTAFGLENAREDHPLLLDAFDSGNRRVEMVYAPFDHVNRKARIVIVGMTPGAAQARAALVAASQALKTGKSKIEAGAIAKTHASFSGEPMRSNLVAMLDAIGVASLLGIATTATLWGRDQGLVHFTSALRYPVFVDGANWSGAPDMVRTPSLRQWLIEYTGAELAELPGAIIVPLGPKVAAAMRYLADQGLIQREQILDGLPHPSGANNERIAYFLGNKDREALSPKTNAQALDDARVSLVDKVARVRAAFSLALA